MPSFLGSIILKKEYKLWQFILGLFIGANCGVVLFAIIKAGSDVDNE